MRNIVLGAFVIIGFTAVLFGIADLSKRMDETSNKRCQLHAVELIDRERFLTTHAPEAYGSRLELNEKKTVFARLCTMNAYDEAAQLVELPK